MFVQKILPPPPPPPDIQITVSAQQAAIIRTIMQLNASNCTLNEEGREIARRLVELLRNI